MDAPEPAARPLWRRVVGSVWFQLALAFLVAGLVLTFLAKPYAVPSASMEPTLQPGDSILVDRLAYAGGEPSPGDIVVFDADDTWDAAPPAPVDPLRGILRWIGEATGFGASGDHTLVKRVIATPGQTVSCCTHAGAILVDGEVLDEPYVVDDLPFEPGALDCATTPRSTRCFDEVTVPDASYLVLGDNRAVSADSAAACRVPDAPEDCWRWATGDGIVGRAAEILWPVSRWSGL